MEQEQMRGLLYKKLYWELKEFKDKTLRHTKSDMLAECFKINLYIVLYEVLLEEIEQMGSDDLRFLIGKECILENLYEVYTDWYGDGYERVKKFVREAME